VAGRRRSSRRTIALDSPAEPRATLTAIAESLLRLLTSDTSVALNRAAMTSPDLAALLLRHGRHTTGPLIEGYLTRLTDQGRLRADDPAEAFQLLYGLTVRDVQIRSLLGEPAPPPDRLRAAAELAVDRFLTLTGGSPPSG
jgi:hypothetical protein